MLTTASLAARTRIDNVEPANITDSPCVVKGALKPVPAEPGPDGLLMLSADRTGTLRTAPDYEDDPTEQTHSDNRARLKDGRADCLRDTGTD